VCARLSDGVASAVLGKGIVLFALSEEQGAGAQMLMSSLSDRAPRSDKVLLVFYDFETTQNTRCTDTSWEHVPNLVWKPSPFSPVGTTTGWQSVEFEKSVLTYHVRILGPSWRLLHASCICKSLRLQDLS
jgi:hypothetical protein